MEESALTAPEMPRESKSSLLAGSLACPSSTSSNSNIGHSNIGANLSDALDNVLDVNHKFSALNQMGNQAGGQAGSQAGSQILNLSSLSSVVQKAVPRKVVPTEKLTEKLTGEHAEGASREKSGGENKSTSDLAVDLVWKQSLTIIEKQLDSQIFNAWIRPLNLSLLIENAAGSAGGNGSFSACIDAPNKFCCDHIQRHYIDNIRLAISQVINANIGALSFRVSNDVLGSGYSRRSRLGYDVLLNKQAVKQTIGINKSSKFYSNGHSGSEKPNNEKNAPLSEHRSSGNLNAQDCNLNGKYAFSNFVVGSCNQFAHAVALKVAESPGQVYNPLFLYGGVGLGKTHLANAVGNACRRRKKKVLVVSSERFVSELIFSLRSNAMSNFKNKFRSLDVLIVDDIQFLVGKERTQEEFFHTFNELHGAQKQVIVTCDKLPQELVGLDERLRTRFISGVSADLQLPDFETRVAILIKKAEACGLALPEKIAQIFAEQISSNIRELEGVLNRFQAVCSFHQCSPREDLARDVLRTIAPTRATEITPDKILQLVAQRYNVSLGDLTGKRRTANIALARQIAMYLCRKFTNRSFPEIGAMFGGRDHSTAIHAHKVVVERKIKERQFTEDLKDLENKVLM